MKFHFRICLSVILFLAFLSSSLLAEDSPAWVPAMKKVHEKFKGTKGYVAQFGDSITYSMAFWSGLQWGKWESGLPKSSYPSAPKGAASWQKWIKGFRDKGGKNGNYSGWRVGSLVKSVPGVLSGKKPEFAIIMIGTNDVRGNKVPDGYKASLEKVLKMTMEAGCIPLLSTIPPMRGKDKGVAEANAVIKALAKTHSIPLIDFYSAVIKRRPKDWDGTLINKSEGVHPTGGKNTDFSEENLKNSGYALRNYVSFLKLREVYFAVVEGKKTDGGNGGADAKVDFVYKAGKVRKDTWDWAKTMIEVAKKFKGQEGKFVPLGDSISYANQAGRWPRYGKGKTEAENKICKWMKANKNDKSNGWWLAADDQPNGRSWTAASGIKSGQYLKGGFHKLPSLDQILKNHNPQAAWILLGTNDLNARVSVDAYLKNMETIYKKCLANGTIPIAQTVLPTTWDKGGKIMQYNEGIIKLAAKLKIPMVDCYGEFLKRRPGDSWKKTLISGDGAHPTHKLAAGPATEDNLKNCGHLLRSWLAIHKAIEIKAKVIDKK